MLATAVAIPVTGWAEGRWGGKRAWVAAQMRTLAAEHGWSGFAGLQAEYSLVQREAERELIPMARGLGLGLGTLAWARSAREH